MIQLTAQGAAARYNNYVELPQLPVQEIVGKVVKGIEQAIENKTAMQEPSDPNSDKANLLIEGVRKCLQNSDDVVYNQVIGDHSIMIAYEGGEQRGELVIVINCGDIPTRISGSRDDFIKILPQTTKHRTIPQNCNLNSLQVKIQCYIMQLNNPNGPIEKLAPDTEDGQALCKLRSVILMLHQSKTRKSVSVTIGLEQYTLSKAEKDGPISITIHPSNYLGTINKDALSRLQYSRSSLVERFLCCFMGA